MSAWDGAVHSLSEARRRLPLRGSEEAAGGTSTPRGPEPLLDAPPPGPDVVIAASASVEPPGGCGRVISSPGRIPVGAEMALEQGSARLDGARAMIRGSSAWLLVEAVRIGMVDSYRGSRPREFIGLLGGDIAARLLTWAARRARRGPPSVTPTWGLARRT
ncbi:unnamed protein product [Prorocentrum cordatum]|uniref:Uncharacterized protein n=1 Tax=Prorocentrum cordatum TaxID=2364126 RepID=A0ABN9RPB9_9DINO|nr:unnamed protein product [Polarella glacialis]